MKHFNSMSFVLLTLFLFAAAGCENHKNSPENIKTYFKILDFDKVDRLYNIFSQQESQSIGFVTFSDTSNYINSHKYIMKFDENGDTLWAKDIEGYTDGRKWKNESSDMIRGIVSVENSRSFVTVSSGGLVSIVPIGINSYAITSYCKTLEDNYIVAGFLYDSAFYVSKVNSLGDSLWTKKYNFYSQYYYLVPTEIISAKDGGFFVTVAANYATAPVGDLLILKINHSGELVWVDTLHNEAWNNDAQIIERDAGELLIGTSGVFNTTRLYRWSANGDSLGAISIQNLGDFRRMAQSSAGELAVVGRYGFSLLSNELTTLTTRTWSEWYNADMHGFWVDVAQGGWMICGIVNTGAYSSDAFILAVDEEGNTD